MSFNLNNLIKDADDDSQQNTTRNVSDADSGRHPPPLKRSKSKGIKIKLNDKLDK